MYKFQEEIILQGVWYLPEELDKKLSGKLTFNHIKGAILELVGSFHNELNLEKMLEPDIILGVSTTGEKITLYKCFEKTYRHTGIQSSEFIANYIFIGAHFSDINRLKFNKISAELPYMQEWINVSGFKLDINHKKKKISIKYKLPSLISAYLDANKSVSINFTAEPPQKSFIQKEATIKQKAILEIKYIRPHDFKECMSDLFIFQNFLSFVTNESISPLVLYGSTNEEFIQVKGNKIYEQIYIYYQLIKNLQFKSFISPYNFEFNFKLIRRRYGKVLSNWFNSYSALKPVYDLYFSLIHDPSLSLEHQFLNTVFALETYHRKILNGTEISTKNHQYRIKQILNKAPEKHKIWLKDKLSFSNQLTLKSRLESILDRYSAKILNSVAPNFADNKEEFIKNVRNTRNYFVHYPSNLKSKAKKGKELYKLIKYLKRILELCILTELKFTNKFIEKLIDSKGHSTTLMRHK